LSLVRVESAPDAERDVVVDGEVAASSFDGTGFANLNGSLAVLVVSDSWEKYISLHAFAGCSLFPFLFFVIEFPFAE
jgi:hypothetical protein